jgi:hypothetical protein
MGQATELRDDDAHGLEWAERYAPSPFMREVARLARSHRMSASEMRRRLGFAHVSTVFNHLRATTPRRATIDNYCTLFEMSETYRDLLLGRPIGEDVLVHAEIMALLTLDDSAFESALGEKVRNEWVQDRAFRRTCLEAYILASVRTAAGYFHENEFSVTLDGDVPGVTHAPATAAFLRAVGTRVALRPFRRKPKAVDSALTRIALDLRSLLDPKQLEALIEVTRALLLANGHDLTFAEKRLAKELAVHRRLHAARTHAKTEDSP